MKAINPKTVGALFVIGGIVYLVLTVGFFFQMPWATSLWPWPDGRLSYIFIASITAAVAAPLIWIGLTGEFGAAKGGAVNLGIAAAGMSVFLFLLYDDYQGTQILATAIISAIFALINIGIYLWSRRLPTRDRRTMPRLVRISFVVFTIMLVLVGTLLVLQRPVVFPWPLKPESTVIFGLIFLGAATYFAIALRSTKWHSARGQLIGFLAYLLYWSIMESVDTGVQASLLYGRGNQDGIIFMNFTLEWLSGGQDAIDPIGTTNLS